MYTCKSFILNLFLLLLILALAGCGGGSGGGNSSSISYTGSTSQAVITQTNGEDIAYNAYQNGGAGNSLGGILSIQPDPSKQLSRPRMLVLTRALKNSISQISFEQESQNNILGATVTETEILTGDCGGSAIYTISVNDVTYDFSGTFTFNALCNEGVTLLGSLMFSGQFNPNTLAFGQLMMSYDNLTVRTGSNSFTADGDITLDPSATPVNVTMNMVMQDNSTGKTYHADNFVMTLTDNFISVTMAITGRLYDPDYGYVDITTPAPLVINNGDSYPSSGVLLATGSNGSSGGPAKVILTALSDTSYQIEIDEDGDGTFEYLDTGNWAGL